MPLRPASRRWSSQSRQAASERKDEAPVSLRKVSAVGGAPVLGVALLAYWVLLGGTDAGNYISPLRILNGGLAAVCIWLWVRNLAHEADFLDMAMLAALLCFLAAAVLSAFPRATLDAATAAMGWVAAFFIARRLCREQRIRQFGLISMGLTGVCLTLLFASLWGAVWVRWLTLADYSAWPPLILPLPLLVFRHPHIVAFTAVMLAPSVLTLWQSRLMRPIVIVTLAATAFLAIAAGSRTIWLGAVLASVVTIALLLRGRKWRRPAPRQLVLVSLIAAGLLLVMLLTGIGGQFVARLTTVASLEARGALWSAALHAWAVDPLTGSGPGTFVQALPLSGFFLHNDFAPRHADNALIQLLSEGGLAGLAGAALIVPVVVVGLLRTGMKAAVWAVMFFMVALATENPTDTAGLDALLVAWIALAIPASVGPQGREGSPVLTSASMAAAAIIAAAYVSLSSASLFHDVGIGQASGGHLAEAQDSLTIATALDPGMALYERELGVVALAMSDPSRAAQHVRRALDMMPTDDIAVRALATAELAAGDLAGASRTIRSASPTLARTEANLLATASILLAAEGKPGIQPLLQAVQRDPFVVGAPSWASVFGPHGNAGQVLRAAWEGINASTEKSLKLSYEPVWLRAMAGLGPPSATELQGAREAGVLVTSEAWVLLLGCHISEATDLLRGADAAEGGQGLYWFVRAAAAAAGGEDRSRVFERARIMNPSLSVDLGEQSPLLDPAQDRRMYGRMSLSSVSGLPPFPSGGDTTALWLLDPFSAADRGAPDSRLATCR